ncbi:MAG: tape measure protein [Bacillota bacterium]|nr:tape measure protein [Bacillota bacterium]
MAGRVLGTTISATDRVTPAARSAGKSIDKLIGIYSRFARTAERPLNVPVSSMEGMATAVARTEQNARRASGATATLEREMRGAGRAAETMNGPVRNIEDGIERSEKAQRRFNASMRDGQASAGGLLGVVRRIAITVGGIRALQGIAGLSDQVTMTNARIGIMNDGLQTYAELQQKIFASAQRARASYFDTADAIAKMALSAGDVFKSSEEAIGFVENLNKEMAAFGTPAQNAQNAMIQISQAMGMGVLRGQEYRSVLENAQPVAQRIASYMGVSVGELKNLADQGAITADILKNAVLAATDDINAQFEQFEPTFEQTITRIKNHAIMAFEPVLNRLNQLLNSPQVQKFIDTVISGIQIASVYALDALEKIVNGVNWLRDNWARVEPVVLGVLGAILLVKGTLAAMSAVQSIAAVITNPAVLAVGALLLVVYMLHQINVQAEGAAITVSDAFSTIGEIIGAVASLGWNLAAMIWNTGAAIAEFLVNVWNHPGYAVQKLFYDIFQAVGGFAAGALDIVSRVINAIGPNVIVLFNKIEEGLHRVRLFFLDVAIGILNAASWLINKIGSGFAVLRTGVENVWYNIAVSALKMVKAVLDGISGMINKAIGGLEDLVNGAIGVVNNMIRGLNNIPGVSIGEIGEFSTGLNVDLGAGVRTTLDNMSEPTEHTWDDVNLGLGLQAHRDALLMAGPKVHEWTDVALGDDLRSLLDSMVAPEKPDNAWEAPRMDFVRGEDWMRKGADLGERLGTAIENFSLTALMDGLNSSSNQMSSLLSSFTPDIFDPSMLGDGDGGASDRASKLAKGIRDNTGRTADALDDTAEDIKHLLDLAARESINKFTTAEFQVTVQNENHIGSEMDLDGVKNALSIDLMRSIYSELEGVSG